MTGELHEVSRAIGALETAVKELSERVTESKDERRCDRELAEQRHGDNLLSIGQIREAVAKLAAELKSHAESVAVIQAGGVNVTRSKLAVYATIGFGTIYVTGWIVEALVKWAVTVALSHFH